MRRRIWSNLFLVIFVACSCAQVPQISETETPDTGNKQAKAAGTDQASQEVNAGAGQVPAEQITIACSLTWRRIAKALADQYMAENKNVNIAIKLKNYKTAADPNVSALKRNDCDVVFTFQSGLDKDDTLKSKPVAWEAVAVCVNLKNSVDDLTLEQVRDIFTGRCTNWKELGGPDMRILPIWRPPRENSTFQVCAMKDEKVMLETYSNWQKCPRVMDDEGAVDFVKLNFVDPTMKSVKINGVEPSRANVVSGKYPIAQRGFIVTNGSPAKGSHLKRFVQFVTSKEGQEIIEASGFPSCLIPVKTFEPPQKPEDTSAWPARMNWDFLTIHDDGFNGWYECSLCLNPENEVHAFFEGNGRGNRAGGGTFTHAKLKDRAWNKVSSLESSRASVSWRSSPMCDRAGNIHLLYRLSNTGSRDGLKYTFTQSGSWVKKDIYRSRGRESVNNFCMTIDKKDVLHICYVHPKTRFLMHGRKSVRETEWKWEKVEHVGSEEISVDRHWPSIAASPDGKVYVTYKKYRSGEKDRIRIIELRMAILANDRWTFETIGNMAFIDGSSQLAVDSRGRPHIVYDLCGPALYGGGFPNMHVVHAVKTESGWKHEKIFTLIEGLGNFHFALDSQGNPHILICDAKRRKGKKQHKSGQMFLASKKGGRWTLDLIAEKNIYNATDLVIDSAGWAHAAFSEIVQEKALALKYGKYKLGD